MGDKVGRGEGRKEVWNEGFSHLGKFMKKIKILIEKLVERLERR